MSQTPPLGQPGGVHSTTPSFHLTMKVSPPQYIWFKGERYQIQAFERGTGVSGEDRDITYTRDWTKAGEAAMNAAEKVFAAHRQNFAEAKIVQVPLTGNLSTKQGEEFTADQIKIGSSIQYARSVSDTPNESITIELGDQTTIQEEIKKIGEETAKWKPAPTSTSQRPQQQSSSTTSGRDTTAQQTPSNTDSTASNPSTPSEIQLPQLPGLPTATRASQNALLSSFLKSQVTSGSTDPIDTTLTCRDTSAGAALAAQINQIRPGSPHVTADSLLKGAAKHIVDNLSSYDSDSDIAEMLKVLRKTYDSLDRNAERLQARVLEGAKQIKIKDYREQNLPSILDRQEPVTLNDKEKALVATAFANYLHNTPTTTPDTDSSPKVFFKAALAFVNAPPSGLSGVSAFLTREAAPRPIHLVIATEKDGNYEMHFRDPVNGRLDSSQTAFILFNENPSNPNGKYSAFNRVAMSSRDPFTELPRELSSSATRPAYYPAGTLHIETGGAGNCAASALADAVLQKESKYYSSTADWHTQLESDKTQIRQHAMGYMFEHPEVFLDKVNDIDMFDLVKSGITDSLANIKIAYPAQAGTLSALMKKTSPYTVEEKKWMIKLYAHYSFQKNNDLDTPFFMAYAKATNTKIALIHRDTNDIFFVTPLPDKAIDASEYLFVYYESGGPARGHYQSINRENNAAPTDAQAPGTQFLDQIIERYNDSHASTIAIEGFLGSISTPDTLHENLSNLKLKAPGAYLALQGLVEPALLTRALGHNEIDPFIAALKSATGTTEGASEALATALQEQFKARTDLDARAKFLTKLIEARTTTPRPSQHSRIQNDLRTALGDMKNSDPAGYLFFRRELGGNTGEIPDDLDLAPLFDLGLYTTDLTGTEPTTMTEEDERQEEIASRKASMVAEAGKTIADYYNADAHTAENARAEFFNALMRVSATALTLGHETTDQLDRLVNQLALKDPDGFFAYRSYLASHPDINSWKAIVDNRDRAMTEIFRLIAESRIQAQANVIKALGNGEKEEILAAVQELAPIEHFALEYTIGKGGLTPEQMADELLIVNTKEINRVTKEFANWIHSQATEELFTKFIPALETRRSLPAEANPLDYNAAYSGNVHPPAPGLRGSNFPAYLAIEDMYLRADDHREVLHASEYAAKHKDTPGVLKAIADSAVAMRSRAQFLKKLKEVKAPSATLEKSKKIQALGDAIADMAKNDIQGFLGLVQITKASNPNEIAKSLIEDEKNYNKLEQLFVPEVKTFEGRDADRRAVYYIPLDQTIYSPALIAQANLIKAAKMDPPAITEELLLANTHASLVLGFLVYKSPASDEPSQTLSPNEQARQGLASIRLAIERNELSSLLKDITPDAYVQKLITTHMNEEQLTDGPAED